ncbi:hypothetical protein CPB84DRAFT_1690599, partial [Gymnopilus junonius]
AAVLRGGILGRIAREYLSIHDVLAGPSVEVIVHRCGYVAPSESIGESYGDDDLSESDMAKLCGTYQIYTGHGLQTATVSWFPPTLTWEDSGYNWLKWTEHDEAFFQKWLDNIFNDNAQPLTCKQWRDKIRGWRQARNLIDNNSFHLNEYLI